MIDFVKDSTRGDIYISLAFISFIFLPLIFFVRLELLGYGIQASIISAHLAFLALIVLFFVVFQKDKHSYFISRYDLLLPLFFFFTLISFSLVSDRLASLEAVLGWLEALAFYFISRFIFINTSTRERFLRILPACGVLMTVFFVTITFANTETKKGFLIFPFGFSRNFVAQLLILPFFVSLSFIHKRYHRGTRLYATLSAFVMFSGILVSRSRAVWLGIILISSVALLWVLISHRAQFKRFLNKQIILTVLILSAGVCTVIYAAHTIMPRYNLPSPLFTVETLQTPLEGSAGGRIRRWMNALPMIRDHFFFGVGPGNWTNAYYKYRDSVTPDAQGNPRAFNAYLQVFGELGIFAFFAFILFILSLFRRKFEASPQVPFVKLSLGAFLVAAAFHITFSLKMLLIAVFLNMSLLSSYEIMVHRTIAKSRTLLVSLSLAVCVALFVTTYFELKYLKSKIYIQLIKNHVGYVVDTPTIRFYRFNNKTRQSLREYIEKYFPAVFYREHPETIDSLAKYGSGGVRNLYHEIAIKEEKAGRIDALNWYKKAEEKNPYQAEIIEARCKLEKNLELLGDAKATCERGCEFFPSSESLHLQLARIYRELGQSQKAITFYEKAISLHEQKLKINWFGKAGIVKRFTLLNDLKEAKEELSQLRTLPNLTLSSIQRRILEVPLINKDIAVRNDNVFFSTNKSGRFELWVWKQGNSLQQLSNDNYVYFHLRLHFKLPRLYFVSDDFGDAKYNIYYRDLNTDDVVRLTDASKGESIGLDEISPDGKSIIYVKESKEQGSNIYQMDPNGGRKRKLTSDRKQKEYLSWHPSSYQFAYVAGKRSLMLYDVTSSEKSTLIKEQFKEIKWPSFSPDGTKIIFTRVDLQGYGSIEVFDFKTKKSKLLTPNPGRYLTPHWMNQSTILYRENKDDNYLLRARQLNTEEFRLIGPREGVVYDPEIIDSGSGLVFLHSDLKTPLSLNRLNLDTNHKETIRFDSLTKKEIVVPERRMFLSHDKPIPVYLYKPIEIVKGKKYPCILWLHGSSAAFSPRWHTYAQFFAHSGYFFVAVNYSEALPAQQRLGRQKELDLQEEAVETVLTYLNSERNIDQSQIFLLGVSAGSRLARYITGNNQGIFAGLIEYSPASIPKSSDSLSDPRLIVWGENDPERLKSISAVEDHYVTPKRNVEVITLEHEGHDLRCQDSIISRLKHTLRFVDDNMNLQNKSKFNHNSSRAP
jgi:O-antigen ligase/predicted esterase/tetratricopeptide (TPR) repeat protein